MSTLTDRGRMAPDPRGGARRFRPVSGARARRAGRARRSLTAAVACLAAVGLLSVPAFADQHDDAADDPDLRLTVTELTGVLGPGSVGQLPEAPDDPRSIPVDLDVRLVLENLSDAPLGSLQTVVEVYPEVEDREQLRDAFEGAPGGPPIHVHNQDIADGGSIAPGEIRGVDETLERSMVPWATDPGGVHPVRIAVTRGTDVLVETITAVVWLQDHPTTPLLTTLAWPLDASPWRTTRDAYPLDADDELTEGSRLDVLLSAVERAPSEPIQLAPAAHLLEDLSDRADGFTALERAPNGELVGRRVPANASAPTRSMDALTRLREVATTLDGPPISGAYADADLDGLLQSDPPLADLAAEAAIDGRRRVQLQLGVEVDASTHLLREAVEPAVLDLLPGDQLLLSSQAADVPRPGAGTQPTSPVRQIRAPSGRLLTAFVADPYLEESLAQTDHPAGPVLAAQRPIAESAMAYLTAGEEGRALAVVPPATWDPSPETAERLLAHLTGAPWLDLAPATAVTSAVPPTGAPLELRAPTGPGLTNDLSERVREVSDGLEAAAASLPDGGERLGDRRTDQLHDTVLRATSTWYGGAERDQAEALLRDVERSVESTFGEVEVPDGEITLTSDTGQIPVTLQRSRGGPILVDVEVDSPGTLQWPEGRRAERIELQADESRTVTFETQALSTGSFPVTVRVSDPSGTHEYTVATVAVRSTAISGPTLLAIAVVVLGLLLAGVLRRGGAAGTRKPGRRRADDPQAGSGPDGDELPAIPPPVPTPTSGASASHSGVEPPQPRPSLRVIDHPVHPNVRPPRGDDPS